MFSRLFLKTGTRRLLTRAGTQCSGARKSFSTSAALSTSAKSLFPIGMSIVGLGGGLLYYHNQARAAICEVDEDDEDEDDEGHSDDSRSVNDGSRYYIPPAEESKMKLFSGNGNLPLANEICAHLGTQLGRASVKKFADGEVSIRIHDNVRGKDVFVIQSLGKSVNENLWELILLVTTLRRASAKNITAVIPYYGYQRSSDKTKEGKRGTVAAAEVARMLEVAGVDRVICVDLHHAQIKGFFGNTPVDNLDVSSLAIPYFATKFLKKPVVVSPDTNGAPRAKVFRDKLIRHKIDASLALIVDHNALQRGWEKASKKPTVEWTPEHLTGMELVGDVKDRDCVIFDDMIDSAARITKASKKLKMNGARRVFAFATHGLFLGNAYERIEKSDLIEVVCVNTIPLATQGYSTKVHQLSVAALLAETIRRINKKKSIEGLS